MPRGRVFYPCAPTYVSLPDLKDADTTPASINPHLRTRSSFKENSQRDGRSGRPPVPDGRRSRYGLARQQCVLVPAKVRVGLTTSKLQRFNFIRAI